MQGLWRNARCFGLAVGLWVALHAGAQEPAPPTPAQTQFDFANGLFHRGFFTEAITEYDRFLADYPDAAERPAAWYRLGEAAYAARQFDKARQAFEQTLAAPPDDAVRQRASAGLGETLYQIGEFAAAVETLAPLVGEGVEPALKARALYHSAMAHRQKGDTAAAIPLLKSLVDGLPGEPLAPFAKMQLGFAYQAAGDLENAAAVLTDAANTAEDPALRAECRFQAAETYARLGWHSSALGAYEQFRTDFPDSALREQADFGYAWSLYHEKRDEEALKAATAFEAAYPASTRLAPMAYLRANLLSRLARHDEALALYTAIPTQWPDSEYVERAQYKIAWTHYLKSDHEAARTAINAFLQARPDSAFAGDAGYLLGLLQVAAGDYEGAQAQFLKVVEQYPNNEFAPEALYRAAECQAQLGLSGPAAQTFERFAGAYAAHPLTNDARLRAADEFFRAGAFEKALAQYDAALTAATEPAVRENLLYRAALALHNQKDSAGSVARFQQLMTDFPETTHRAEARCRIGEHLLASQNDAVKAITEFEAALEAAGETEWKARALRGLALARYETKDFAGASELFLQLAEQPGAPALGEQAYTWTGEYFFEAKDWAKAARMYEAMLRALPAYPNPERVLFRIAECAEHGGDGEEVLPRLQAVVDAAPDSSVALEARYRMARIHEAKGRVDEAIALYDAASQANSGDIAARSRFRLGEIHEGRGEFEAAARSFMQVAILYLHEELSSKALLRAGAAYEQTGSTAPARKAYEELLRDFAESPEAAPAQEALARLNGG